MLGLGEPIHVAAHQPQDPSLPSPIIRVERLWYSTSMQSGEDSEMRESQMRQRTQGRGAMGPHTCTRTAYPSWPINSLLYGSPRHESHTWSLERSESLTSDSQSGIMLSSVGTSKCNSPACVEARARRAAAYSQEERRRAAMPPYHDSIDSLRDSPHSERSVSTPPLDLTLARKLALPTQTRSQKG